MDKNPLLRKDLVVGIILLFVGAGIIPTIAQEIEKPSLQTSSGHWLYVGGSGPGNYSSIIAALHNASNGDTIYIYSGVYTEGTIGINISVTIIGQSNTTTILNQSTCIFNTTNIILRQCRFQNYSGISIYSQYGNPVSHNTVSETIFDINSSGITIVNSSYNTIINNHFNHCGIIVYPSIDFFGTSPKKDDFTNTLLNNTVNGEPLVYLENVNNRYITDAGEIILLRCQNITISQISFNTGVSLIECIDTANAKILNNDLTSTMVLFINSSENTISHNRFSTQYDEPQTSGLLFIQQCNNNDISNNVFPPQYTVALLMSSNNTFTHNDFYGFSLHGPIIAFINADNTWKRNFWMRPRILPKLILGYNYSTPYFNTTKRSFDIDWRPTLIPNNPVPNWMHNEIYIQQKAQHLWIQFDRILHKNPMILEDDRR